MAIEYLPLLTDDDVRYICSVIPHSDTIDYFKHNPNDFRKISRGFRVNTIARDVDNFLFKNRNNEFVSSFIEKHISNWISHIKEHVNKCVEDGDKEDLAYLHTLPYCPFADNIALYLKIIEKESTEDYVSLLSSAISAIKEVSENQEKSNELLDGKDAEIQQMQEKLDISQADLDRVQTEFDERSNEINVLTRTNHDLEKRIKILETHEASLKSNIQKQEQTLKQLKKELSDSKESRHQLEVQSKVELHERDEMLKQLKKELFDSKESRHQLEVELSVIKDSRYQLEVQIRAELEKQQIVKAAEKDTAQRPKRPKDIEEFKDYLRYNLENIGIPTNSEYYPLLIEHLSSILFQGKPILINRGVGVTLMKCVANALIGTSNVKTLVFRNDLSEQVVDDFLSAEGRIVCLDNFIGNYNETLLLSLFENHRNKIIFLTVAYDRTLNFVPDEFLRYCHYINLNRIEALSINSELNEDPSTVDEIEVIPERVNSDSRYSSLLKDLLSDFGVQPSSIGYMCSPINNERDLCRVLAFDVLPYCRDVLQVAPYNTSDRFIKYAGAAGRCPYKNLFKGWFA